MSKGKGRTVTALIMILLLALLYAVVCFRPSTAVIILGVFAVPGFATCSYLLYKWLMLPEAKPVSKKHN